MMVPEVGVKTSMQHHGGEHQLVQRLWARNVLFKRMTLVHLCASTDFGTLVVPLLVLTPPHSGHAVYQAINFLQVRRNLQLVENPGQAGDDTRVLKSYRIDELQPNHRGKGEGFAKEISNLRGIQFPTAHQRAHIRRATSGTARRHQEGQAPSCLSVKNIHAQLQEFLPKLEIGDHGPSRYEERFVLKHCRADVMFLFVRFVRQEGHYKLTSLWVSAEVQRGLPLQVPLLERCIGLQETVNHVSSAHEDGNVQGRPACAVTSETDTMFQQLQNDRQ
mmetsp:Transcript_1440/g.3874  ORF Transcript_1440/g.3874 Transcript_1440/m.3874 type:complete len:276 (+) Transcript_1440:1067-1894(+)